MTEFNPRRGDVKIELEGCELVLRPSFAAIVTLEDHFNCAIFDLAREFCEGKRARIRDFLVMIEAGVKGTGAEPPPDLAERMVETGLARLVEPLGKFLAHACGIRG
ncbi:MAG: gene transfer agent family protein [Proteobacteria bacterium]|nr:gene transfer agent family protein [Pseudomonadota bacterium]